MVAAISTFLALVAWYSFANAFDGDFFGIVIGALIAAFVFLLSFIVGNKVRSSSTENRLTSIDPETQTIVKGLPNWAVGVVAAAVVCTFWGVLVSPYRTAKEAERIQPEIDRFYASRPPSRKSSSTASPYEFPGEQKPYACQSAHYDAATCAEQMKGNAEMGRYVLGLGNR